MKSIISFIICISATTCGGAVSVMDGRLVSCRSYLLRAWLPSSPSRSLISALVPSCSYPWLLGPTSIWRNCSSRSWFCLVRRSATAARVCTCLLRVTMHGFSPVWLLVAIKQVSTIQLFIWEVVIWLLLFYSLSCLHRCANWWCQKSSVSHTVLTCSRQNLRNRNKEDLVESIGVVPVEHPPKVKLKNFHNSKVPELG